MPQPGLQTYNFIWISARITEDSKPIILDRFQKGKMSGVQLPLTELQTYDFGLAQMRKTELIPIAAPRAPNL